MKRKRKSITPKFASPGMERITVNINWFRECQDFASFKVRRTRRRRNVRKEEYPPPDSIDTSSHENSTIKKSNALYLSLK